MFLRVIAMIAAISAVGVAVFLLAFDPRPAAPMQPIEFSHKLHADEYKIDCLYCHIHARRSVAAGVPSMQLCMGCHKNVGKDKPEVQQLTAYWEQERAVEWRKVNDLPDFVYFSHKRHVTAEVACETCHGEVKEMERVSQGPVQTMESCVNCHLVQKASIDCLTCHK